MDKHPQVQQYDIHCTKQPILLSVEELLEMAQPLRGPDFDPDRDIEDWSDDSSDDDDGS